MKKIYILATALFLGANINAQLTIDFETFTLPASVDTFDNGSAGGGDFIINVTAFSNFYDTTWNSWSGFAISNMTDTITAGWGNQYSSVTGNGASNSATYGVYYPQGSITSNGWLVFDSIKLANTTYAALSMRDGDAFAKKFGDTVDANGAVDGTNGEDFLKVWIIADDMSGNTDSVEFFLADYRFADSTQDYILKSWKSINLTGFSFNVLRLKFRLESSDNAFGFMNTPAYFAIDNISGHGLEGLDEIEELNITVYPNPVQDILTVKGENGRLTLTDMNGKIQFSAEHSGESKISMATFSKGIYLLKMENATGVVTRKIIK